jgi:hypothetical protein
MKNPTDVITEAFLATNDGRGIPYIVASVAIEFALWSLQNSGVIGELSACECGLIRVAGDGECPHLQSISQGDKDEAGLRVEG